MCYSPNYFAYGGYILEVIQEYHKLLWTLHNMFVTIIFNGFLLIDMTYLIAKDAVSLNNVKNEFEKLSFLNSESFNQNYYFNFKKGISYKCKFCYTIISY